MAERILRVKQGSPVVRYIIKEGTGSKEVEKELFVDKDKVEQEIAQYFCGVYNPIAGEGPGVEPHAIAVEGFQMEYTDIFTMADVEETIASCNFNKGMGPDAFDGNLLKPHHGKS